MICIIWRASPEVQGDCGAMLGRVSYGWGKKILGDAEVATCRRSSANPSRNSGSAFKDSVRRTVRRQYQNLGYFLVLGILFTRSATTSMTVAPNPTGTMTYT